MNRFHNKELVYADNAATTRLSEKAREVMQPYLSDVYGNPSQPYSFSRATKKALNEARELIAECINSSPEEIVFTSGGTESDNFAIKGFALGDARPKTVITSPIEHHAVLNSCTAMQVIGHTLRYLCVSDKGVIDVESLRGQRFENNSLVSCMFANNEIGTIQPVPRLCEIAHERGAIFHTDAVQAVGHVEIDVKSLGVDMLSASAHKFNGPRGVGFLYVKGGTKIAPYASGGSQESGRRAGTENVAGIVGMSAALKENCDEIAINQIHLRGLEAAFESELRSLGIQYHRNGVDQLPGLLSLSFPGKSGEALLHRLDLMGILVSTGSACNGSSTEVSHVLNAICLSDELAKGTIRISFGKDNTLRDVFNIATALAKILLI